MCPQCGPVRVGHETHGEKKVRICKKCGATLEK
jgi:large subunit ribosomal protein L24